MKREFKNKSLLERLVFSRFAITVILLLIQLGILISIFLWLGEYATYLFGGMTLISFVVICYIINSEDNPSYKIAWLLPVLLVPVLGTFLYLFIQTNVGTTGPKKLLKDVIHETSAYTKTEESVKDALAKEPVANKICSYIEKTGGYATYQNTEIEYYPLGEDAFEKMKEELEKAKKYIFLEYFIVEEGLFWDSLLAILERKATEGVEVRMMYDDLGCVALLPRTYAKTLTSKGIKAKAFSALKPFLSSHYNNRDHRKIMVIDGRVAFNGGINLADEYINAKQVYGHWKDTSYKVTGDAVKGYIIMFLQMWNVSLGEHVKDYDKYLKNELPRQPKPMDGFVTPYGDGPHQLENVAENVYIDILYHAQKYVYIMSPYLILDNEMLQALEHAAKSGVEVKLLLPHIPDKWFAVVVAKSYYPTLIRAGVEIYQYTPGFVHAKMFVADDEVAVVGTINLDFRSLYLHYECGGFFYKNPVIQDIIRDFHATFENSQRISIADYKKTKTFDRLAGRILRIIGPLM